MTGYPNLMILAFLLRYNDRKYIYNYVCVVPLFVFPRPNNNDSFQKFDRSIDVSWEKSLMDLLISRFVPIVF